MRERQFLESSDTPTETFLFCWSAKYCGIIESCDSHKTHTIRINVCDASAAWVSQQTPCLFLLNMFLKREFISCSILRTLKRICQVFKAFCKLDSSVCLHSKLSQINSVSMALDQPWFNIRQTLSLRQWLGLIDANQF